MQATAIPSSGTLSLISKFGRYIVLCLAILSIPVCAYLSGGWMVAADVVTINSEGVEDINCSVSHGEIRTSQNDSSAPIAVSLWAGNVWGTPFKVPIRVDDLTGHGIRSFELQVSYDPARLSPAVVAFDTHGTLSSGMILTANTLNPGHIIISGVSTTDLSGSGTLIYLKFQYGSPPGLWGNLIFEDYVDPQMTFHPAFQFNAGTPSVTTNNGHVSFFWPIQGTSTPTATPTVTPSTTPSATPTAAPTPCDLSFDSVNPPALPGNWSVWYPWHPNYANYFWGEWTTSNNNPDTPPNAMSAPDPWSIETMRLTSPSYYVPHSGGGQISFRNFYDTEYSFDGMVLELSIDGGSFQDILTAGGSFLSGGYNSVIGSGYYSSLEGRNAWSGNSGGYITTTVQLPPAAIGPWIQLAWVMASDSSVSGNGVKIDTITGLQCFAETPTPTPTPTATPTATPVVVSVTVGTAPEGRSFTVDGVTYNSGQTFSWPVGSEHTISTTTPQSVDAATRYVWNNWSDGGELSHMIIAGASPSYIADFRLQYQLTTCCTNINYANYVFPQTGFFDAGSTVQIYAGSGFGFVVRGWFGNGNGSYTGPYSFADIVMNGPISEYAVFQFPPDLELGADFDGDYRSDISVFRPSEGNWYLQRSTAGFTGMNFGLPSDKIVPADYDRDGKSDVAVFRPSDGNWYSLRSEDGTVDVRNFGVAGDIPAPADYDGDGGVDLAVFRPSNGTWYIWNSGELFDEFTTVQFGQDGDQPAIGDYNGDRKFDIAVFRPSTGVWYWISSSNGGFRAEQFGSPGDRIVQARYHFQDYSTDMAVYRPSTGTWYIRRGQNDYLTYQFGSPDDIPVPGRYDQDQIADIAVFRPSNGTWYIANSSDGSYTIQQFGQSGDIPTQSAFGN